jgi:clan AA aspartic protease (TIGR02281 family)
MKRSHAALVLLLLSLVSGELACAESYHLKQEGGVLLLPVQINHSITLDFTIDSGASDVVIPEDVFSTLSRTGTITSIDMLASGSYEMADGSHHEARRFRIRSLEIGQLELRNIAASVAPAGATLLLGQSFLAHLPGWSIDNQHGLLIVGEPTGQAAGSAPDDQAAQSLSDKAGKWLACAQPFNARVKAAVDYDNQLAVLYPRFGLLWNEWMSRTARCTAALRKAAQAGHRADTDVSECSNNAIYQAHADLVARVAATAEPEAVRLFNFTQTASRLATSEMEQTCGLP